MVGVKGLQLLDSCLLSFLSDNELLLRPDVVFAVNASLDKFFSLTRMRNINVRISS